MTREEAIRVLDEIADHYRHMVFSSRVPRGHGKEFARLAQWVPIFDAIEVAKKAISQMKEEKKND